MSSPDRASTKRTPALAKAAPAKPAKAAAGGKTASKTAGRSAEKSAGKSAGAAGDEPSPQEKADFLKAMSKGITPNTEAARKVEAKKKSGAAQTEAAPKVEVLRRIPAPAAVENTPESAEALRLAAMIEKALIDGELEKLQPHAQQALIAALCKYYAANADMGNRYAVLGQRSAVSATDVMVMCGALLKAVDLQVFELGMWQSWSNG
jgi:hypothetical protein